MSVIYWIARFIRGSKDSSAVAEFYRFLMLLALGLVPILVVIATQTLAVIAFALVVGWFGFFVPIFCVVELQEKVEGLERIRDDYYSTITEMGMILHQYQVRELGGVGITIYSPMGAEIKEPGKPFRGVRNASGMSIQYLWQQRPVSVTYVLAVEESSKIVDTKTISPKPGMSFKLSVEDGKIKVESHPVMKVPGDQS